MNKFQQYTQGLLEATADPLRFDMSKTLKRGDHLFDRKGQKVDEIEDVEMKSGGVQGGVKVHTRAGYTLYVNPKTGGNAQGWTNKKPTALKEAQGDVGHEETEKYGVHFKPGDKVKDNYGKHHVVVDHHGPVVRTKSGATYHPTKLHKT